MESHVHNVSVVLSNESCNAISCRLLTPAVVITGHAQLHNQWVSDSLSTLIACV